MRTPVGTVVVVDPADLGSFPKPLLAMLDSWHGQHMSGILVDRSDPRSVEAWLTLHRSLEVLAIEGGGGAPVFDGRVD